MSANFGSEGVVTTEINMAKEEMGKSAQRRSEIETTVIVKFGRCLTHRCIMLTALFFCGW